ncbi:MAG TPA: dienelactone hydrolase family protein [Herpetosiphonaceae bacterium]
MSDGDEQRVWLTTDTNTSEGSHAYLGLPDGAQSIVIFANDQETMKHGPAGRFVGDYLRRQGIATLSTYLLTPYEARIDMQVGDFHLDLGILTERLVGATDWLARRPETQALKIGYFGAGLGAAAALIAAAARPQISAVVARGGKPEPAELALPNVKAPTLFILGEHDAGLLPATHLALDGIKAPGKLEIVPGASHLFEEDGALERMAALAADWFRQHCAA